jgi:hypothetical protein
VAQPLKSPLLRGFGACFFQKLHIVPKIDNHNILCSIKKFFKKTTKYGIGLLTGIIAYVIMNPLPKNNIFLRKID